MSDFLPNDYTPPKQTSNYMKLEPGENVFRILSEKPIIGYEYWTTENKPVRSEKMIKERPVDLKVSNENFHWTAAVKHFWAFVVWDYSGEDIKILEITQASIQTPLTSLFKNEDWGHPSDYDITINREGEGMETRYSVMPKPHKELSEEIKKAFSSKKVNLEALFSSDDPFAETKAKESIKVEDLPY